MAMLEPRPGHPRRDGLRARHRCAAGRRRRGRAAPRPRPRSCSSSPTTRRLLDHVRPDRVHVLRDGRIDPLRRSRAGPRAGARWLRPRPSRRRDGRPHARRRSLGSRWTRAPLAHRPPAGWSGLAGPPPHALSSRRAVAVQPGGGDPDALSATGTGPTARRHARDRRRPHRRCGGRSRRRPSRPRQRLLRPIPVPVAIRRRCGDHRPERRRPPPRAGDLARRAGPSRRDRWPSAGPRPTTACSSLDPDSLLRAAGPDPHRPRRRPRPSRPQPPRDRGRTSPRRRARPP